MNIDQKKLEKVLIKIEKKEEIINDINNKNIQKLEKYRIMLNNIIIEYHKICNNLL